MQITRYTGLNNTPALPLLVRGWAELIESRLVLNQIMVNWEHDALVAWREGPDPIPVGVMSYHYADWTKEVHIPLGYVVPQFRRQGVYRALWDTLVVRAHELGAVLITSSTAAGNHAMRDCAAQLGREDVGRVLRYRVEKGIGDGGF